MVLGLRSFFFEIGVDRDVTAVSSCSYSGSTPTGLQQIVRSFGEDAPNQLQLATTAVEWAEKGAGQSSGKSNSDKHFSVEAFADFLEWVK